MNRDIYQKETEARFDSWNAELNRMKAEVDKMQAEARQTFYIHLAMLRQNMQEVMNNFEELRASGDDMWQQMRADVDTGLKKVESGFEDARESFRKSGVHWTADTGSEGWPEGQGEIIGESEGWSEGQGRTPDNSKGWVEGQGRKTKDSVGWPEGQKEGTD
jgi:hypothetical protein